MTTSAHPSAPPAPVAMFSLLSGAWQARSICVAAKLRVADFLLDGPRTITDIATSVDSHAPSLRRLLRALASVGVFAETPDGRFANTELSITLRPDAAGSMYGIAMGVGDWGWKAWADLEYSVRTGQPAFDKVFGTGLFGHFRVAPEAGALFDASMTGFSESVDQPVAEALDLGGVSRIVDIGGGHGSLVRAVLAETTDARAVLFDQPHVIDALQGPDFVEPAESRIEFAAGDFFDQVPAGADLYLMKMIMHDWSDDDAVRILRRCREAMKPGARLAVVDIVLDPDRVAPFAYFLDLQMLAVLTGRERTEREFEALFAAADLELTGVKPTASMFSVVEGVAAT